jgi:hypothetical protein
MADLPITFRWCIVFGALPGEVALGNFALAFRGCTREYLNAATSVAAHPPNLAAHPGGLFARSGPCRARTEVASGSCAVGFGDHFIVKSLVKLKLRHVNQEMHGYAMKLSHFGSTLAVRRMQYALLMPYRFAA